MRFYLNTKSTKLSHKGHKVFRYEVWGMRYDFF